MSTWRTESRTGDLPVTGLSSLPSRASQGSEGKSSILRSDSGLIATLLDRKAVEAENDLNIRLAEHAGQFNRIGVVEGFAAVSRDESDDLCSLLKHCDLIAVPSDGREAVPDQFEECGELDVALEPSQVKSFRLFQSKPIEASKLTKGAPTGQGESEGHLEDRESWFKSRHSNRK